MRIRLSTSLPLTAEAAAALADTPALLCHVAAPLLRFVPIDPPLLPLQWNEQRYRVRLQLAGIIPLGRQWIDITRGQAADGGYWLRDNGSGDLANRWDHRITIAPDAKGGCTYVDDVRITAGLMTPFVWSFAWLFYAYRQHRWRRLAAGGAEATAALLTRARWRHRLDGELLAFAAARKRGDLAGQWHALERAHILSQPALAPHLSVHVLMLRLALQTADGAEVLGQLARLLLAPLGALSGRTPWGNTGRASVNAFRPMPVPPDLLDVLPPCSSEKRTGG